MDLKDQPKRYVTLVPEWLATHVRSKAIPFTELSNLESLAHKVSVEDVCFYVAYNTKHKLYVGDLADDFISVLELPHNKEWLSKHARAVSGALAQFEVAVKRVESDRTELSDSSAPVTVRKTSYVPVSLDDTTIAYIGEGSSLQFDRSRFCKQCIVELNKMLTYDAILQLKVFETFCTAELVA